MVKSARQSLKGLVAAAGSVLLIPAAQAAGPVFDSWSVDSGQIQVTCPSDFTCETVSAGDGFGQIQWTDQDGNTFIQTIITDQGASSDTGVDGAAGVDYSDESFIQLGNVTGIMSQQHSQDNSNGQFDTTTKILRGWANDSPSASDPTMSISQSQSSDGTAVSGDEFNSSFNLQLIQDDNGTVTDRSLSIDQTAGLGDGQTTSTDAQRYVLEQRQGDFTTTNSSMTLDESVVSQGSSPQNDGGTVDWVAGDDVMLRWIGQRVTTEGTSVFGFEGITNDASTQDTEATTFSTASTGIVADAGDPQGYVSPFDWDATFGATPPTLPAP